ncbi:MAG: CHAT domain-containing protein, partial [Myxococcales bacterium]|nr:CHAT domain-containing protein [Myxococcales bacterium]
AVLESGVADAKLVHLALHASVNTRAPWETQLRLGDGPLALRRVLSLKLGAQLVLLSACQSGVGGDGSGSASLARAFQLAGARRVLSTLWRVSDLATAVVVKRFVRELARGRDPAVALQQTRLALIARWPHPAFWAGLRLHGL